AGVSLYWRLADGSDAEERLASSSQYLQPFSWSPLQVLALMGSGSASREIWMLPLDGERQARPFLHNSFNYLSPMFSPDGRWLAYESDESGTAEVWAQPYPGPADQRQQLSVGGGSNPQWNPNGRELFYRNGDKTMVVDVTTTGTFTKSAPRVLYQGPAGLPAPKNAERFLAFQGTEPEQPPTQVQVLLYRQ